MTRVLVVDDMDVIARPIRRLLEDAGHDVVEVTQPELLLDPDTTLWDGVQVLLTDLWMPVVSGLDLLRFAWSHHPGIYRLALTALADGSSAVEEARDLADQVLQKPNDVLRIAEIVSGLPGG